MAGEEASGLPALLFGGRRGPPGECSLPQVEVDGRAMASSGSSWGSSCSPGIGMGAEGGLPGPPRRAAAEVLGRSSALVPSGLSEGTGPGVGDPPREAAVPGAATGLPSRPPAAWPSSRPSRRRASPPHRCTATSISWCTNVAARFWREAPSSWTRRSSSSPKRTRRGITRSSTMAARELHVPKITPSS